MSAEVESAWIALMRAPRALLATVQAELKASGFPPLDWYDVLLELNREADGRLRQRELGSRLLLARYNLSRLLDRLEAEGLVAREPVAEDARGSMIVLTEAGKTLRAQMWPAYAEAVARHLGARLDAAELTALASMLKKLR